MRTSTHTTAALGLLLLVSCADGAGGGADRVHDDSVTASAASGRPAPASEPAEASTPVDDRPPVLGYEVVQRYPHDKTAYTQGLLIVDGKLYESTGRLGESSVRLVDLKKGEIIKRRDVDISLFGEGLASVGGLLYQLTWKAGKALLYDREKLQPLSYGYSYPGEGWGLTTSPDGLLVMSDGTDVLRFLEPKGMKEVRRVKVTNARRPLRELNELEWIGDEIWANVWKSDRIARIDPETGAVTAWVDLSGILGSYRVRSPIEDVLNGIAYDAETEKLYVTGKRWPYLFEIVVKE